MAKPSIELLQEKLNRRYRKRRENAVKALKSINGVNSCFFKKIKRKTIDKTASVK